jgi:hypothetical protein
MALPNAFYDAAFQAASLTELTVVIKNHPSQLIITVTGTPQGTRQPMVLADRIFVTQGSPAAKTTSTCHNYTSFTQLMSVIQGRVQMARLAVRDTPQSHEMMATLIQTTIDEAVTGVREDILNALSHLTTQRLAQLHSGPKA